MTSDPAIRLIFPAASVILTVVESVVPAVSLLEMLAVTV